MVRLFHSPKRSVTPIKAQMRVGEQWQEVRLTEVFATGATLTCADAPDVGTCVEIIIER